MDDKAKEAQERLNELESLISYAQKAGADAADACFIAGSSRSAQVRLGQLEEITSNSSEDIGLRVFIGQSTSSVSTSDMSQKTLRMIAERCVAMARNAPEDPWAGLAPEDRLARDFPDLDLVDSYEITPQELETLACACEDEARSHKGISNSEGAGAQIGSSVMALMTSHGFASSASATSFSLSASVIAGEGDAMQRDYAWSSSCHFADLDTAQCIGKRAAERTLARLNPQKIDSGIMPVIFDGRVSSSLIRHFLSAISGEAVARGTSFLRNHLHKSVFSSDIAIVEEPHRPRGLRSTAFDGEGLATGRFEVVRNGVLQSWLMDSASARQLGMEPTGHASRSLTGVDGTTVSNLIVQPGAMSRDDMISGIERGILVTELIGMGVNTTTGDYSRGASGFLIDHGAIARPVHEITIAGNLIDMFGDMTPASDLELRYGIDSPSLLIAKMTVAGSS